MSVPDRAAEPAAAENVDSEPVLYEVRDSRVAVLTLNRPRRMNAWSGRLARDLWVGIDRAEADPAVRAIVVTGTERAFCAGADMGDLSAIRDTTVDDTDVDKLVGERHPCAMCSRRALWRRN